MLDFLKRKKDKKEIHLALSLQEQGADAFLLEFDQKNSKVLILGKRSFSYSNSWERLVEDVDEVLFNLEEAAAVKATKCIVCIYSHLVDKEKKEIKQPYFDKIKAVASDLGLEMMGYMEHHETLSSYLSKTGAGQLNCILCEIDSTTVSIFIYRNGQLDFTKSVGRTVDYVELLEQELTELAKTKTLPLRIILYGIGNLDHDATIFMSKRWPKDVFVQLPRVETVSIEQMDEAMVYSYKNQLLENKINQVMPVVTQATSQENSQLEPQIDAASSSDTGFIVGEDIGDIGVENQSQFLTPTTPVVDTENFVNNDAFVSPGYTVSQNNSKKTSILSRVQLGRFAPNGFLIVIIGMIMTIGALFILLYSFHKATVTLLFDSKPITTKIRMDGQALSISSSTKQLETTDTILTTGVKFIGEKARGELVVFNKGKSLLVLPKGTIAVGPKNLRVVFDSEVRVASASEQLTQEGNILTVTGKEKVLVTADEIGEEYNLNKDVSFVVQSSASQVTAQSSKSLTGGSKKEVRTASSKDFETLRKQVIAKIKKDVKKSTTSAGDSFVIDALTSVDITSEEFTKEVAQEAGELGLTAKAKAKIYVIPQVKARELLASKLAKSIPSDQTLDRDAISFTIENAVITNGKPSLTLNVKGIPLKKVDTKQVAKSMVGKSVQSIDAISKQYLASGYEYKVETELPFLKNRLPLFEKNLSVSVKMIR